MNSFVPGTPVLMADGSRKPIEQVELGDKVLATDPHTGHTQPRRVVATITGQRDKSLVDLTVRDVGDRPATAKSTITARWGTPSGANAQAESSQASKGWCQVHIA